MGPPKRPPLLPAPTESSLSVNNDNDRYQSDASTNISHLTDRTHYSLPEDGREIKIPTKKGKRPLVPTSPGNSRTSLLIDIFEGGKSRDSTTGRPNIRLQVTPHARKVQPGEVKVKDIGNTHKPSNTRRVSFDSSANPRGPPVSFHHSVFEGSNISPDRSDIDLEMGHQSELSELPPESNVSSMPGDSILDEPVKIKEPERQRSRSLDRVEEGTAKVTLNDGKLAAPELGHSRSVSKERITRKALEKIAREQSPEPVKPRKLHKTRPQSSGSDQVVEEAVKTRSRRSSNSHRGSSDMKSYTESSLLPPRDNDSNLSGGSKVSLNNPKLLATVEDAIRRLILPEIETLKRNQSVRSTRTRDSYGTEESMSRSGTSRRLSKTTSEPYVKGRRLEDISSRDPERRRRKHHKTNRDLESEATSSRRDSLDSVAAEKERIKKSKHSSQTRDSKDGLTLTRANLKSHTSSSSVDEKEHKEKRKHREKSKSGTDSVAETDDAHYKKNEIPPMPMNSEIQDSDLTRTSLLSAETAESEDVRSKSDRTAELPNVKTVTRGEPPVSPSSTRTAREVRSKESRELKSSRSDRSISSKHHKTSALAAAGLGGAAGALYGYKGREHSRPSSRRSSGEKRVSSRDHSPSRHSSRAKKEAALKDNVEEAVVSKEKRPLPTRDLSKDSVQTASSTDYPVTSKRSINDKRHETLNYSESDLLRSQTQDADEQDDPEEDPEDPEDFYRHQHELNERYRNSLEEDAIRESGNWDHGADETPNGSIRESVDIASVGREGEARHVKGFTANPKVIEQPQGAESAVASLINQSMVSEQSGPLEPGQAPELHHKDDVDRLDETRDVQAHHGEEQEKTIDQSPWLHDHANTSAERWNALRDRAQQMSSGANSLSTQGGHNSPVKQEVREVASNERPRLGSNAIPLPGDDMPEVGFGQDNDSELTDHDHLKQRPDSIVEGPLGDEYENRGLWPYEPTPDLERRGGFIHPQDRDSRSIDSGIVAAMGAATGAGLGIETARSAKSSQPSLRQQPSQSSASEDARYARPQGPRQPPPTDRQYMGTSLAAHKDEGYISAAHPRSPSIASPLSFSKPPPQLFDERDARNFEPTKYTSAPPPSTGAATPEQTFARSAQTKHDRHFSINSHGLPAESYDAAMGTGINNIESKDVVALMDHLTVRDGHRNARDTEILVTLVRSAAEMRNQFDELKNQVDMQGQLTRRHDTNEAKDVVNKVINNTRAAAMSNNSGVLRSSRFTSPSSDRDEPPAKKKNIFKRALSGLGSKSEKDVTKIEDMLMQLLEDVEALRDAQASSIAGGSQIPTLPNKASLDSYERLRAAPDPGYEPEGQAGTSSTPNASGTFSPAHSRQSAHRMHSGYNVNRDPHSRISTVHEHPDENIPPNDPRYENDDGMITPTQEAQNQRSATVAGAQAPAQLGLNTPPSSGNNRGIGTANNNLLTPNTPRTGDHRQRQKSTSSSVFGGGIPRISRWSKTTTSSAPRDSFQRDRPYSEASQSGSDVNVLPGDGYEPHDDDRIRTPNSLTRDAQGRSPSPLLPQDEMPMDDPKYHANRHSLTLEHPQPRQGNTHRHQNHLESQAYGYHRQGSERSLDREGSPGSPPGADVFGSEPGLAKNRYSVRRSSRGTSGEYGTPLSTGSGGYRAPARKEEGPLVPAQTQSQPQPQSQSQPQTQMQRPAETRRDSLDSLDSDQGASAASYRRPEAQPAYSPSSGDSIPDNVREEWEQSPHTSPTPSPRQSPSPHTSDEEVEREGAQWPQHSIGMPLERPRSPYHPGAQLTTIEERYSLEQSRVGSPMSRHQSVRSRDLGSMAEEEGEVDSLGDDQSTPRSSPVKAARVASDGARQASGERKVTPLGPRAMGERREVSGGTAKA